MVQPTFRPTVNVTTYGNAFAIIGAVSKALRGAGADSEYVKEYMESAMAKSYDNLLRVSMEYVDFNINKCSVSYGGIQCSKKLE